MVVVLMPYIFKLKCPKCGSHNCIMYQEVVHAHVVRCNRRTGWMHKNDEHLGAMCELNYHYECEDCGYGHSIWDENNDDFIVGTKEIQHD